MIILLFAAFFVLLFIGMPIAYAMAISSVAVLLADNVLPGLVIAQKLFTAMDSFSLMAIPFFMLAGSLMEQSGITRRLVHFANTLVGHFTGGLGHATIITGVLMAGVSGSANADTSAIASIMVPALKEEGYDPGYSCAMISGCGALGPVIPPSIMMVIYAGVTSISIAALFMAGFIPGLLIGLGYMVVNYFYAKKHGIPRTKFVGWKNIFTSFLHAIPALGMPFVIIGGILSGVVTATEAGVLACLYSMVYGLLARSLNGKKLYECITNAVAATTNPMIIIAFAALFGYLVTNYNFSKMILAIMTSFTSSQQIVLLLISVVLFVAGMFIDSNAAMLMLIPVFTPLIALYGFDKLHFAMVCILTLVMGGMSPPVGLLMYIAAGCTNTPLNTVVKNIWWFIVVNYAIVILAIFIPQIIGALPALAGLIVN
ncbi:MAG: TRAP transporter large permease [Clostridiales bacterium]|nr:TRAP transporter large permease [Clostridiales bacterium]